MEQFPSFFLIILFAESEGFEPPVRRNAYTTFRVWLFRPLRQLSEIDCKYTTKIWNAQILRAKNKIFILSLYVLRSDMGVYSQ